MNMNSLEGAARYFLKFSYIGTGFRGAQKPAPFITNIETIQGSIEWALGKLYSVNKPSLVLSSRTDAGVHALTATAHVDLVTLRRRSFFDPFRIAKTVNQNLHKERKAILIKDVRRVNSDFHARFNAKSRTYLYRLVTLNQDEIGNTDIKNIRLPIEEFQRSLFVTDPRFDISKIENTIKLFEGTHDFETFKKFVPDQWTPSIRTIQSAEISKGLPMVTSYSLDQLNYFNFWDIKFKSRGFVYNQVRRMVGALISVATGKITDADIITMLRIPSKHSWISRVDNVPPSGLYLCNVEYDENDLIFTEGSENISQSV